MDKPQILVMDSGKSLAPNLRSALRRRGFDVAEVSGDADLLDTLRETPADLVIIALSRTEAGGWSQTVRRLRRQNRHLPVILVTWDGSESLAVAALRAGVNDYFRHSTPAEELAASVERCLAETRSPSRAAGATNSIADGMIGESPRMRDVKAYIARVAATDSNVLITGETGTGKELVAELIHRNSPRHQRPFVSINCAAIPETLLESELFGYERGAFTGARDLKEGALRLADGGSVFFDEIGDMSPLAQAKILRAIETKEVQRLGGQRSLPLHMRIIAATNQDLEALIDVQRFRRDLYYRINVARIHLPPLRERKEDIPRFIDHYIREFNRQFGQEVEGLTDEALDCLLRYDWPGNVREFRNLLEATFVNLPSTRIALVDLPDRFRAHLKAAENLPRDERARLLNALFATNWNKSKAAARLHWSRMTIYRKIAKYRVVRDEDGPVARGGGV